MYMRMFSYIERIVFDQWGILSKQDSCGELKPRGESSKERLLCGDGLGGFV